MLHLGNFGEKFVDRFLGMLEPIRLMVYGNPSEEAAVALGGFGAVVNLPTAGFAR